ncbi:UNVERIFIED_CONTAM: hypothetical protein GTU68_019653 [Idotea baltica]|nr:hypothetical protein [Idotea baltica]
MTTILAGEATHSQIAGLLVGLKAKGEETVEELTGFATAMMAAAKPLAVDERAIDIVGTGGSAHRLRHALNVSTMASIVAASAGAIVCKHGNRRASSTSGSSDFLEALGIPIDLGPEQLRDCVAEAGIGFAFARLYHPAVRFAGPVRVELGVPTAFNLLGPMSNPARVTRQLVGVASPERAAVMAEVLLALGLRSAWVVSGAGGLDELSTTGDSVIYKVVNGAVEREDLALEPLGIAQVTLDDLAGGTAEDNLAIFEQILAGARGPHSDIVVLNAGAALVVAGVANSLPEGTAKARAAIDDGRTEAKLGQLREVSNRLK